MTGKSVKDIDRYQAVLTSLLALEENKFCADCHAKGKIHISQYLCIEQIKKKLLEIEFMFSVCV